MSIKNPRAEGVSRVGTATMKYVLDLAQKEESPRTRTPRSGEIQMGLNRVINRLRDLSNPARLAWDGLIWELQEEQQNRLELVRVDVSRHGSLLFYLGHLGR